MADFAAHPDAVVTIAVRRAEDVSGHNVVIVGRDGRVVGYQQAPDPAEALSDLVDTGEHVVHPSAHEYGDDVVSLLEQDVPVYAVVLDPA
jgi:NDP-sugar pyrophosphorylase family protein